MTLTKDPLWPAGNRPGCLNGDGKPTYLAGLCGDCWADHKRSRRPAPASRPIRVDPEVYAELHRRKLPGETMTDVVARLVKEALPSDR